MSSPPGEPPIPEGENPSAPSRRPSAAPSVAPSLQSRRPSATQSVTGGTLGGPSASVSSVQQSVGAPGNDQRSAMASAKPSQDRVGQGAGAGGPKRPGQRRGLSGKRGKSRRDKRGEKKGSRTASDATPGRINPFLPGMEGYVAPPPPPEEENPDDVVEPMPDIVIKKPESSEEFLCATNRKQVLYDLSRIPAAVRLNAKRKTALDYIYDGAPKPEGYLPEKQMPAWLDYPLSKLLPTVPAPKEYFYYSRGNVGEKLNRPNLHFTVADPYNQELALGSPYIALHDEHAKKFYEKPLFHKQLVKQKLVSKTNKAICSMKDFNKYRQYLFKRIYVDDVRDVINDKDKHQAATVEMVNATRKEKEATDGKIFQRNERIRVANELKKKSMMDRLMLGMEQTKAAEQHEQRYMTRKRTIQEQRRAFNAETEKISRNNIEKLERTRMDARAVLLKDISAGDKANTDRRKHDLNLIKRAHKQFQLEWMDAKWDYQRIMVAKQKMVNQTVNFNTQTNAQKRQDRIETLRSHMRNIFDKRVYNPISDSICGPLLIFLEIKLAQIIAKRKRDHKRLWEIVRKYFNRWRDNVRKRKERRPDAMHKSNWDVPMIMDNTLQYLYKESGYEKLDDFIMGIVLLKKRIKAELEAEEAAEAAEAAALAAPSANSERSQSISSQERVGEEAK